MLWLNWLRRQFALEEVPPATTNETKVTFVLKGHSPQTLAQLSDETNIPVTELLSVLYKLKKAGKIRATGYSSSQNSYWHVPPAEK